MYNETNDNEGLDRDDSSEALVGAYDSSFAPESASDDELHPDATNEEVEVPPIDALDLLGRRGEEQT